MTSSTLVEVRSMMRYRNFCIRIFKETESDGYFFEPIVVLDPKTVASQVNKTTGQAYVRFTIQMWTEGVRAKVVEFLKRLETSSGSETGVEDYNVQVMPYERVRLVMRNSTALAAMGTWFDLPEHSTWYHQLNQSVDFYLLCDLKETADLVADDLRTDPAYSVQHLGLECSSTKEIIPTNRFSINTLCHHEEDEAVDKKIINGKP